MSTGRVQLILALLGDEVLLLSWPLGSKGTRRRWKHLTSAEMKKPGYLLKLQTGNVGVALGQVSRGLCTVDFDDDEWGQRFLEANPTLAKSLRTRGARGFNVWLFCVGDYPRSQGLKDSGRHKVGEFRADGNQTIISGMHPATNEEYRFLVGAPPVNMRFADIIWPDGIQLPKAIPRLSEATERREPMQHSNTVTQSRRDTVTQLHSHAVTQVVSGGGCVVDVQPFLPSAEHQNNALLFDLARAVLLFEWDEGRKVTSDELFTVFQAWHGQNRFLNPENTFEDYWLELQRALDSAKVPLGFTPLSFAIERAAKEPIPEVALQFSDPAKRKLVAVLWQLQLLTTPEPFFITCRDAGAIPGVDTHFATVHRWLQSFCSERTGFLSFVKQGSQLAREGNEYQFRTTS